VSSAWTAASNYTQSFLTSNPIGRAIQSVYNFFTGVSNRATGSTSTVASQDGGSNGRWSASGSATAGPLSCNTSGSCSATAGPVTCNSSGSCSVCGISADSGSHVSATPYGASYSNGAYSAKAGINFDIATKDNNNLGLLDKGGTINMNIGAQACVKKGVKVCGGGSYDAGTVDVSYGGLAGAAARNSGQQSAYQEGRAGACQLVPELC
jgi:hypothetical protein